MLNIIFAFVSLLLTTVMIFLPWRLKIRTVTLLRKITFFLLGKFPALLKSIMKRTENNRNLLKIFDFESKKEPFESTQNEEISLMFSGGSDSTLAAIILTKQFKRIHLITFKYSAIKGVSKANEAGAKLINKFGPHKIVHNTINIEELFREIYINSFWKDLKKYGLFTENICAYCKCAMLIRLLIYNIDNKIKFAASGANKDAAPFFAAQMPEVCKYIKQKFKEYGIIYLTPVFNILRTDRELFNLGFSSEKEKKFPNFSFDENQASCDFGMIHHIYAQGFFIPLFGRDKLVEISYNFMKDKFSNFNYHFSKYSEKK